MKKRTLSLALAAAMAVSLAGCGSSSSGTADKPAETKSAEGAQDTGAEPTPHSGHLLPLLKKSLAYP